MNLFLKNDTASEVVWRYGGSILDSDDMQREKDFLQHGDTSVYWHSVRTAIWCIRIAYFFRIPIDMESLIRGALLHDYFLYDWHEKDHPRAHAVRHAGYASKNAARDFGINEIERNMIRSHMFPLSYVVPRYRESVILVFSDKISTVIETVDGRIKR